MAQAGTTSIKYGTCLHRSSDGYNQCWDAANGPSYGDKFQTYNCDSYFVRFDGDSPTSAHGVGRTNAIAIKGRTWNGGGFVDATGLSAWTGLGGLASVGGMPRGTFGQVDIYLGAQNSFANVRVQASGPEGCGWYP